MSEDPTDGELNFLDLLDEADRQAVLDEYGDDAEAFVVAEVARGLGHERALSWLHNANRDVRRHHELRRGFEERLADEWPWTNALSRLDLLSLVCVRAARRFRRRMEPSQDDPNAIRFHVLARLHRRALLVTSEIHALLRSGHASGANARWRTLHEIAVVSSFIQEHDERTAERYVEHQHMLVADALGNLIAAGPAFEHELPPPDEIAETFKHAKDLKRKYGPDYAENYGWAKKALRRKSVEFKSLERAVQLGHWRPYVDLSHDSIHAGARALFFDIGAPDDWDAGPIGPTNLGLREPGQNTAISLRLATAAWIASGPDFDALRDLMAIDVITDLTVAEFERADEELAESIQEDPRAPTDDRALPERPRR